MNKEKKFIVQSRLKEVRHLKSNYFINSFYSPEIAKSILPGQFIMVESGQFLLRPFSVCEKNENEISILYKNIGKGTSFLSKLKPNDQVTLHGPLGRGFTLNTSKNFLVVAGGSGIASFPYVAELISKQNKTIKILYGARDKSELVLCETLKKYGDILTVTDNGSCGRKGFVTDLLKEELNKSSDFEVLVCGPTPMLKSVFKICSEFNVTPQISFEEFMACGYGVCMSCVVLVNGKYIRTCTEGPVMKMSQSMSS